MCYKREKKISFNFTLIISQKKDDVDTETCTKIVFHFVICGTVLSPPRSFVLYISYRSPLWRQTE